MADTTGRAPALQNLTARLSPRRQNTNKRTRCHDHLTRADWEARAKDLKIEGRAFVNGEYSNAASGETFDCLSPVDGRFLAKVASCDLADAEQAVKVARNAFDSGAWSRLSPAKRKQTMIRFADLLLENAEELALLETLDMGKPISDSLHIDVASAANSLRWSAEAIDKIYDEVAATPHAELGLVTREPVGVVAAIVPWNFPLLMSCWKLGPALATGNSVILKPSEKSPLTAIRIAQLAVEAGIPKGVFNVLPGYGHTVGKALALHMDVDTLVFTGSTKIAKQLMVYAGESNMKRVWLEAGGRANIVFADAPDLKAAAEAAAGAIAFNQGEVCTAGSRLLVERSIKDKFLPLVIEALKGWKPGNPLDPETNVGALVDTQQMNTVLSYIEAGHNDGAKLVAGGKRTLEETGGTYVEPTIFDGVTNAMKIAREEIFGPVLSVIEFEDAEEAVRIANDTPYGLAAAVWTSNPSKAHLTARPCAPAASGQPVRRRRHDRSVRRLQAVGQRSRQVAARLRQVHRAEGDLDQALIAWSALPGRLSRATPAAGFPSGSPAAVLVRRIYPLAPARLPGCQRENRNALGKLFRRLFRSHQHRPRPWPDHAAGLVAPGELGLRQFRHRRDGQHAGSGRAARRDDRRARRARRYAAADAVVPAHRGSLHRPAGTAAELPGMAVAAPSDRRAAHRGVHPRGKLDQPVGGGEVAWPAGRAVRHRLRPQPTVRAGTADLHRYRRRPWLLVRRLPADCWLVAAAGPRRCAQGRSAQRLRARFVGLLPGLPAIAWAVVLFAAFEAMILTLLPVYGLRQGFPQAVALAMVSTVVVGDALLQLPIGWLADRVRAAACSAAAAWCCC